MSTQKQAGSQEMVPRRGTIYDRLDKARAQRLKSLSPPVAANQAPKPQKSTKSRAVSKSQMLPAIKSQEDFDPIVKSGLPGIAKLGLGLFAFSIMAGFTLLGWGTNQPQTTVTAPVELQPETLQTNLPGTDAPAQIGTSDTLEATTKGDLPLIPSAPADAVVVEAQQEATPLVLPQGGAQDP
ncbi:MAG: hypothetical protein ABJN21_13735 [Paracoccaceae bacterium]